MYGLLLLTLKYILFVILFKKLQYSNSKSLIAAYFSKSSPLPHSCSFPSVHCHRLALASLACPQETSPATRSLDGPVWSVHPRRVIPNDGRRCQDVMFLLLIILLSIFLLGIFLVAGRIPHVRRPGKGTLGWVVFVRPNAERSQRIISIRRKISIIVIFFMQLSESHKT